MRTAFFLLANLSLIFVGVGCQKSSESPTGGAPPPTESTSPAPATSPGPTASEPVAAKPTAAPEISNTKPETGKATEQKSVEKPAATSDAPVAAQRNLSDTPLKRKTKPPSTLCARACNKAQQCGTARGGVANCIGGCLRSLAATEGDLARQGLAFRAQERCADLNCSEFDTCVGKALVGEEALMKAPPLSPKAAAAQCIKICGKEKECSPDRYAKRPGGHRACLSSCEQVWIAPTDQMAIKRVLLQRTLSCLPQPCDRFEACVRKEIVPERPDDKGHDQLVR